MKFFKVLLISAVALLFLNQAVLAGQEAVSETDMGEKLVRQLWAGMKKTDMKSVEKKIAEGFQSVHQDGANNRMEEIELIKNLKLGEYTLSNFHVTRNGPVIVATYFVSVEETIKGRRLTKKPAPRLSVFLKTDDGWKWIAHANLKPLGSKEK
ncbi:MAG: nuclear transport factor 2 family protein [Syntrophales bacterium]|nr:nuclear transport factor 2 family protein [Syntrophales bacterium]